MTGETQHLLNDLPADLSSRERLEFELSQLADGTLDPERRAEVERAAKEAGLTDLLDEFRDLDALLTRDLDPVLLDRTCARVSDHVMSVIRADEADCEPMPLVMPTTPAATGSSASWRRWIPTAVAAAAALAVGVSIGLLNQQPGTTTIAEDPQLEVDGPSVPGPAVASTAGVLEVGGPTNTFTFAKAEAEEAVLSVHGISGPDLRPVYSPESVAIEGSEVVASPFSDFADVFNAGVVVERPTRVSIAAAE